MNMFKRDRDVDRGHPVDMDNLAEAMRNQPLTLQRRPDEFAPRRQAPVRVDDAIEQIETFFALPLKEIDDTMGMLKAEYDAAVAEGQTIRDTIMAVRADYLAQIKRRRALTGIAKETFAVFKQHCAALDAPAEDTTRAEEPQTTTEHDQGEVA